MRSRMSSKIRSRIWSPRQILNWDFVSLISSVLELRIRVASGIFATVISSLSRRHLDLDKPARLIIRLLLDFLLSCQTLQKILRRQCCLPRSASGQKKSYSLPRCPDWAAHAGSSPDKGGGRDWGPGLGQQVASCGQSSMQQLHCFTLPLSCVTFCSDSGAKTR